MEQGLMRGLRSGTTFIEAGNEASNLTLIYRGTMTIISSPKDGRQPEPVGAVHRMQFVESPQWANIQVQRRKKAAAAIKAKKASKLKTQGSKQITAKTGATVDDKFTESDIEAQLQETGEEARTSIMKDDDVKAASTVEVTFKAATDVVFFMWRMERLQDFLEKNTALMAPLNAIVGADVAAKLFSQAKAGGEIDTMSMQRRIYLPLDDTPAPAILPRENSKSKLEGTDEIIGTDDGHHEEESGMDESEESASPLQAEKLWLEQRGEKDTKNDHKLARILRQRTDLDRYELSALISKGRWHRILRADTVLIREGEPMTKLYMILRGKLSVFKGEDEHARLLHNILPQQLAGSIEWSELGREHIAGETVVSVEPCIYIAWDLDDLRIFLGPRPKIRAQLTALLASDLAAKFRQVVEDTQ